MAGLLSSKIASTSKATHFYTDKRFDILSINQLKKKPYLEICLFNYLLIKIYGYKVAIGNWSVNQDLVLTEKTKGLTLD